MQQRYLFTSIFLILFAINANAACPFPPGPVVPIYTIQDLQNITWCLPAQGRTFKLQNDIDATGFPFEKISNGFDGILDGRNPISGANYRIVNLQPRTDGGLIDSITESGVVKNLILENVIVYGGSDPTNSYGALVGVLGGQGRISNVSITSGTITGKTPSYLGGLVGKMLSGGIDNCMVSVALVPGKNAAYNGVLVGKQEGGIIDSSSSSGYIDLTGETKSNGGIVGQQSKTSTDIPVITRSHSSTTIVLSNAITAIGNGVFAGSIDGKVTNCYSNGMVINPTNPNARHISGLFIGYLMNNGVVDKSYATGKISNVDPNVDGFIGLTDPANNDPSCTNSYWDTDTTGVPAGASAACSDGGRSTEDMQSSPTEDTFIGWDQQKPPIWQFMAGSYPTLLP